MLVICHRELHHRTLAGLRRVKSLGFCSNRDNGKFYETQKVSLRSNLDKILDAISRQMVYEHLEWEIGSLEGSMGSVRNKSHQTSLTVLF